MGDYIEIETTDKSDSFSAYLAKPAQPGGSVILVLQEIFGITDFLRSTCDQFAAQGYYALAPDVFWRQQRGVDLNPATDLDKAVALRAGYDLETGIEDIKAAISYARSIEGASGKVGANGFCFGGFMAYMVASKTDIDASVGYYGVNIHNYIETSTTISKPLMLHIAVLDSFVPPAAQASMHAGLGDNPLITLYDYSEADHAFARASGSTYHKESADLALSRSLSFFQEHL